jgi:hypothetical protein
MPMLGLQQAGIFTHTRIHAHFRVIPHTHIQARRPFGLALDFLVLLYLPARSRLRHRTLALKLYALAHAGGEGTVKMLHVVSRHGGFPIKLSSQKHQGPNSGTLRN